MKILVLGSTGMLGNAVGNYFRKQYGEESVILTYRNEKVAYGKNSFAFDPLKDPLEKLPHCDVLINCIGIIKPFMKNNTINAISINSLLPWQLADFCARRGNRLFHITTDCVFSGKDGNYSEKSPHDALDDYGKSKSLGEADHDSMVIRTSIIGEEIHKDASLIAWVKAQDGKEVNGFTNHWWNGITTKQYAKVVEAIIKNDWFKPGLFHVFSNRINKFDLVKTIADRFKVNLKVKPFEASPPCDRTLSSIYDLCSKLNVPSIQQQIQDI